MNLLRRVVRRSTAAALVAVAASAAVVLSPGPVGATGGTKTTFAAVFDRSVLVVVATVLDAPTVSAGYRLSVERVIKGPQRDTLTFAPDPKAVALVPGERVVLLLADLSGLDFRGTVALPVASDGSIDPDGLANVPATVADLEAAYGSTSASVPPTTTLPEAPPPARDPVALLVLAAASITAGVILVVAFRAATGRRRA